MPRSKPQGSFQFGTLTYSVGLALIVSAAILNLTLDKLTLQHLYLLPDFLVDPYEQMGTLGVTLLLGGVGVVLVTLGIMGTLRRGQRSLTSGGFLSDSACDADPSAQAGDSRAGAVVLATQKYVGKRPFDKARSAVVAAPAEPVESCES
jgi:hypothetical protein